MNLDKNSFSPQKDEFYLRTNFFDTRKLFLRQGNNFLQVINFSYKSLFRLQGISYKSTMSNIVNHI